MKTLEMVLVVCFVLFIALLITGMVLFSPVMIGAACLAAVIGMITINELDSLERLERHNANLAGEL